MRVTDGIVLSAGFDWADVGCFADLQKVSLVDESGNHLRGSNVFVEDTTNSYVRNETEIPVAVIGLDGVVVVATEHGLLVSNAHHSQKVGDIAKRIQQE
jgi:mannose-1-phosphate guanylyltransferase